MDKTKFLADLAVASRTVVSDPEGSALTKDLQGLDWQYWKMLYGPGNPNQITDAQASAIGATAVEALLTPLVQSGCIVNFFKLS